MRQIVLRCVVAAMVFVVMNGCSDHGKLTNEAAQRAVNQWAGGQHTATVSGVLELPQENSARVDLQFSQFRFPFKDPMLGGTSMQTYSGPGVAVFAHYNDGRWVLSQVSLSNPSTWGPVHWDNLNIVAAGEGAPVSNASVNDSKCTTHDDAPSAIVGADEARFVLPVGKRDQWDWNVEGDGTQGMREDYLWSVEVPGDVRLMFQHWSEGQPEHGNLAALLAAGTMKAIRTIYSDGGRHQEYRDLAGATIEPTCENVAIVVQGKDNVNTIFSSQPKTVTFVIHQPPDRGTVKKEVSVTYKN